MSDARVRVHRRAPRADFTDFEKRDDVSPTHGMNEGCFILIMAMSSYLNPVGWLLSKAKLWDKCYCLVSEVVCFGIWTM